MYHKKYSRRGRSFSKHAFHKGGRKSFKRRSGARISKYGSSRGGIRL